jgi:hypothetical protein
VSEAVAEQITALWKHVRPVARVSMALSYSPAFLVPPGSHDLGTIRYRSVDDAIRGGNGHSVLAHYLSCTSSEYRLRHFTVGKVSQAIEVATSRR